MPGDPLLRTFGLVACLACGDLPTLDAVHNALLFIPVGLILIRAVGSPWRAVGLAALVSLVIELVQLVFLPDRDPALLDLAMNASGGAVGVIVSRGWWRLRSGAHSPVRLLMLTAVLLPLGILASSAVLLRPVPVPRATLFGQWAPRRPNFEPRRIPIVSLKVGPVQVPHGFVPDQGGLRAAWDSGQQARLHVQDSVPPSTRPLLLARLVSIDDEVFLLAARADALLVRVRLVASNVGLRPPIWQVRGIAGPGPFVVQAGLGAQGVLAGAEADQGTDLRYMAFDPALGWALLLPFELPLGEWRHTVSSLWIGVLFVPLGFFSGWRGHRRRRVAAVIAGGALLLCLGGLPLALGSAHAHWMAWLGGAVGLGLGWRAGTKVLPVHV